jgi:hypothetical protein
MLMLKEDTRREAVALVTGVTSPLHSKPHFQGQ